MRALFYYAIEMKSEKGIFRFPHASLPKQECFGSFTTGAFTTCDHVFYMIIFSLTGHFASTKPRLHSVIFIKDGFTISDSLITLLAAVRMGSQFLQQRSIHDLWSRLATRLLSVMPWICIKLNS